MNEHGPRRWSVGELARAVGITVRTLHYYDEIGLVSASERTRAGHRRYTSVDIRRLYRVRALHQLGLSLDEIATALDRPDDPARLRDLLGAQLSDLDTRAAAIDELRHRIESLLKHDDQPGPEQLLRTLELSTPLLDAGAHLTRHQQQALAQRGQDLGQAAIGDLKTEFFGLVGQLRQLLRDHVPVGDPRVRALADRWFAIGVTLRGATAADERMNSALASAWREHGDVIDQGMADRLDWLSAGDLVAVVEYVEQARGNGKDLDDGKNPDDG